MVTCSTILSTAGCRSLRPAQERIVHDTVKVERTITIRDTVLKAAPASVSVAVNAPCPELKNLSVDRTHKHARLTLRMDGDSLKANCLCDTNAIRAQLINTHEKQSRSRTETLTRTVREKYVPWWVKFLAWSGGIMWPLILWGLYVKLSKR